MKKGTKLSNKSIIGLILVIVGIIVIGVGVFVILFTNNKQKNSLDSLKSSVEKVFFYLPDDKYDNMNEIPDYCKISMVFGTSYLKYDKLISKDDYSTKVTKKDSNAVESYKDKSVISAVQSVLGNTATINFSKNSNGIYDFLIENNCKLGNDSIDTLNYNGNNKYIYSIDNSEDNNNSKLYVKWGEAEKNGNNLVFSPQALITLKNADGSYNVYADKNFNSVVGTIGKDENIETALEKMYIYSKIYMITFKKQGNNYIWTNYEIVNNGDEDESIICE